MSAQNTRTLTHEPGDKEIAASTPTTHRSADAPGQREAPLRFRIVGAGAVRRIDPPRAWPVTGYGDDVLCALPRSAARLREGGLRIASGDATSVLRPAVVTAGSHLRLPTATVLAVKSEVWTRRWPTSSPR